MKFSMEVTTYTGGLRWIRRNASSADLLITLPVMPFSSCTNLIIPQTLTITSLLHSD